MRLGSVKGVELTVNPFFLLLGLAFLYLGVGEILWVILALILHEAAHTLAAFLSGRRLLRIELFPFGGQISTEDMVGDSPGKDVLLALAGPAVSLFSAGLTYIMERNLEITGFSFFMEFSLLLGLFNLLPALPLDGGRVLKALLSMKVGIRAATTIGSWSGRILALVLLATGVFLSFGDIRYLNLLLVAGFLGYKAREELQTLPYGFTRYLLRKRLIPAADGMTPGALTVAHGTVKVGRILSRNLPETSTVVLVIDDEGKARGILTERVLIETLLSRGPLTTLDELLRPAGNETGPGSEEDD